MASAIDLLIAQPKPIDVGAFDRGYGAAQKRQAMRLENLMGEERLAAAQFKNERAPIEAEQTDMAFEMEVQKYIRQQAANESAEERKRNLEQSRVVAELGPQGALQFAQANPGLFDPDDLEVLQTNPKTAELIAKGYLLMANETPKPMSDIGKINQDVNRGFVTQEQRDQKIGGNKDRYEPVYDAQGNPVAQRNVSTGQIVADPRAGQSEKAPAGYRFNGDVLEPIPGGPAASKQNEKDNKQRAAAEGQIQEISDLRNLIKRVKDHPGRRRATGTSSVFPNIPGGQSESFEALVDTLKARLGFAELARMRANSPTGGALGQITERELSFLQSANQNLERLGQTEEQYLENLNLIDKSFERLEKAQKEALSGDAGSGQYTPKGDTDALLRKYGIQ